MKCAVAHLELAADEERRRGEPREQGSPNSETSGRSRVEIVGLAKTSKYSFLLESAPEFVYFPYRQPTVSGSRNMYLVLRGKADPKPLVADVRRIVQDLDGSIPISAVV